MNRGEYGDAPSNIPRRLRTKPFLRVFRSYDLFSVVLYDFFESFRNGRGTKTACHGRQCEDELTYSFVNKKTSRITTRSKKRPDG